jgi:hypothetical protein
MDLKDDIKSMKSFKSKGSIRSEMPIGDGQLRKKNFVNTIQHPNEDESDEESENSSHNRSEDKQ